MKLSKKVIVIILISSLAAIILLIFSNYKSSPKYSLNQLVKAIENHDIEKFKKYFNTEDVAKDLFSQALENEQNNKENNGIGKDLGLGIANLFEDKFINKIENELVNSIETGNFDKGELSKAFGSDSIIGIKFIEERGKIATVGIGVYHEKYDTTLIINLKMRDIGSNWEVMGVPNAYEMDNILDELEANRLKKLNAPIKKKMYNNLVITEIKKNSKTGIWGLQQIATFEILVKNMNNSNLKKCSFDLNLYDNDSKLKTLKFSHNNLNFKKGEEHTITFKEELNPFIEKEQILFDSDINELNITYDIDYLEFEDETFLRLYSSERK